MNAGRRYMSGNLSRQNSGGVRTGRKWLIARRPLFFRFRSSSRRSCNARREHRYVVKCSCKAFEIYNVVQLQVFVELYKIIPVLARFPWCFLSTFIEIRWHVIIIQNRKSWQFWKHRTSLEVLEIVVQSNRWVWRQHVEMPWQETVGQFHGLDGTSVFPGRCQYATLTPIELCRRSWRRTLCCVCLFRRWVGWRRLTSDAGCR